MDSQIRIVSITTLPFFPPSSINNLSLVSGVMYWNHGALQCKVNVQLSQNVLKIFNTCYVLNVAEQRKNHRVNEGSQYSYDGWKHSFAYSHGYESGMLANITNTDIPSTDLDRDENCVALDCEMVGVGPNNVSVLARVSIVNYRGEKLLDAFVRVEEKVTDYRTVVSGIRSPDLKSPNAISYGECRSLVLNMIRGKVLIGHGLVNDLTILNLEHPFYMIRDTSLYYPFMRQQPDGTWRPRRLAELTRIYLGKSIQQGEHSSIEDALSAMSLYQLVKSEWDQWVLSGMTGTY